MKTTKGYRTNGYLQVEIPDSSRTFSRLDAATKLVHLSPSTKVKPSDSAPPLAPTSPIPTTSITSFTSLYSLLASKHSDTALTTTSSCTTISAREFGFNGCSKLTQPPHCLCQAPRKREMTFSGAKSSINDVAITWWIYLLIHS